jgi:hypothetical protein
MSTMKATTTFKSLLVSFAVASVLVIAGCSKENIKPATTSGNLNITSPYYVTGLLGDEKITISGPSNPYVDTFYLDSTGHQCGQGGDQDGNHGNGNGNYNSNSKQIVGGATWTGIASSTNATVTQGSIQFLKKLSVRVYVGAYPVYDPTGTALYNMMAAGNNLDFTGSNTSGTGVAVSIRDSKGVLWTTAGDQTGSKFTITSEGNNQGAYTIISGSITAKMYDGNGNVKQLSSTAFNAMLGL